MAGTTPVTILGEPLPYVCRNSYEDSAPSRRIYNTDDSRIIILCKRVMLELLCTVFIIGGVVVGTTLVTILGEPLPYVCRNSDEDLAPSRRIYNTDDSRIIILCKRVMLEAQTILQSLKKKHNHS